jgi:hypothetical protein
MASATSTPFSEPANKRSLQTLRSTHGQRPRISSACLAPFGTTADCFSESLSFTLPTFLRPLAPRALPRFPATTDALTSAWARLFGFLADFAPLCMNTVSDPKQISLLNVTKPSRHSVSNHPSLSPVL